MPDATPHRPPGQPPKAPGTKLHPAVIPGRCAGLGGALERLGPVECGDAHRVLQPGELRRLREECDLRPWPAGERDLFVRIVPGRLTGRRIR
jgi:hypothetical protein